MLTTIRLAEIGDIPAIYELICQLEETKFDYAVSESICNDNITNESCP